MEDINVKNDKDSKSTPTAPSKPRKPRSISLGTLDNLMSAKNWSPLELLKEMVNFETGALSPTLSASLTAFGKEHKVSTSSGANNDLVNKIKYMFENKLAPITGKVLSASKSKKHKDDNIISVRIEQGVGTKNTVYIDMNDLSNIKFEIKGISLTGTVDLTTKESTSDDISDNNDYESSSEITPEIIHADIPVIENADIIDEIGNTGVSFSG